jgi:Mn-dependent DtxR family transcriptional regulator
MAQKEAIKILKLNKGKRYTSKQLAKALDISQESACSLMKRLRRTKLIQFEEVFKNKVHYYEYWVE